ncbi:hypothetical protein [Rahnella aceris]|jgi:hypothetical protein|uniref:Uncharacterized protein n=1 Tax=Rahnella sp. (strain Y9602) TaxID=2703885 RepID=A0ABW6CA16_RAHSY
MSFDFDEMAYPDIFLISGTEFKGSRGAGKRQVDIPYTDEPIIELGDIFIHRIGSREIFLKVVDISISRNGTLNIGTSHPHLMTLTVENTSADALRVKNSTNTFNIGSVTGEQVQIGESNHLLVNISFIELVQKVAKSDDTQAKSMLKKILENSTVASIVGAGASALLGLL